MNLERLFSRHCTLLLHLGSLKHTGFTRRDTKMWLKSKSQDGFFIFAFFLPVFIPFAPIDDSKFSCDGDIVDHWSSSLLTFNSASNSRDRSAGTSSAKLVQLPGSWDPDCSLSRKANGKKKPSPSEAWNMRISSPVLWDVTPHTGFHGANHVERAEERRHTYNWPRSPTRKPKKNSNKNIPKRKNMIRLRFQCFLERTHGFMWLCE